MRPGRTRDTPSERQKGAASMYSSAYVWAKILSHMEERLGAVTVSAWFDDAEVVELNENNLILYSPSDFRREIIRRRCTDYVQDALKEIFNSDAKLLVFGDAERDNYLKKEKPATSMDFNPCLLYTSPSPRDLARSRMPSSA